MNDAFDIGTAQIVRGPDVRSWPITKTITSVTFTPNDTVVAYGPTPWPNQPWGAPGDSLQFTCWLFRKVNGTWVGSGFIERWQYGQGMGDAPSDYHRNWFYGDRWAPMHEPGPLQPTEQIGFMLTAGAAREDGIEGARSIQERTNIVLVPATDTGVFTFAPDVPAEPPASTPNPPQPPAPPVPYGDIQDVLKRLDDLALGNADIRQLLANVATKDDIREARNEFIKAVKELGPGLLGGILGRRQAPEPKPKPAAKKKKAKK